MLNDEEVDQLIEDTKRMSRELQGMAENDKYAAQRERAARWLSTLRRTTEYAVQCSRGRGR
jgi:hypothetical protein